MPERPYIDDRDSIPNEAVLWRWVGPDWWRKTDDGSFEVSSGAFQDRKESGAASFFLAEEVLRSGRRPEDLVHGRSRFGLVELSVAAVRDCGLGVCRDPTPDEPAHVLVFGKKSGAVKNHLKRSCTWLITPPE
jgi:hypothetical protein